MGLGNVDNTSDANKPVSTATQDALNLKADSSALTAHASATNNPHSVTKAQVGLGNVDNTSDANKPVSTATQDALNGKADIASLAPIATSGDYEDLTNKPAAGGLDANALFANLPNPANPMLQGWSGNTDAPAAMTGLSQVAGVFKASVDNTKGRAVIPIFSSLEGDCRVSFRIKVNKSMAAGRRMTVGFAGGTPSVATAGGDKTFEVGFSSIGIIRTQDNTWGDEALSNVAVGALTDGAEYDISLTWSKAGPNTAGSANAQVGVLVQDASGNILHQQAKLDVNQFDAKNVVITSSTNVGELSNVKVSVHPMGEIGIPSYARMAYTTQSSANEFLSVMTPAKPNGRLVIALHGLTEEDMTWVRASGYAAVDQEPMARALVNAGYTVAAPRMRGTAGDTNTAGNATARQCIIDAYSFLVNRYGLHRRAYILANSAGSLAGLITIATRPFPIAAAYLAEPPCDLAHAIANNGTVATAWSGGSPSAYDPMQRPASDFTDVPMLLLGSASDTTVPKANHMTPFMTKLNNAQATVSKRKNWGFDATGAHGSASHFRIGDMLTLFRANP